MNTTDLQKQPTPEQIADAARLAADDIALVFRIWPYSNLDPLGSLRVLHLLLTPPAPKWVTTEELQDCGHPVSSIAVTDDGNRYCSECANDFEPVWYDV